MDINDYIPSLLNPRQYKKKYENLTQNSVLSRYSLSLKRSGLSKVPNPNTSTIKVPKPNTSNVKVPNPNTSNVDKMESHRNACKEIVQNKQNTLQKLARGYEAGFNETDCAFYRGASSLGFSDIDDLSDVTDLSAKSTLDKNISYNNNVSKDINESLIPLSSATELNEVELKSDNTAIVKTTVNVSFGVSDRRRVEVNSNKSKIRGMIISNENNGTNIDCELIENSNPSTDYGWDGNMNSIAVTSPNKVVVNLEIKKKLSTEDKPKNSKVLVLNTNDIGNLTNVTVQQPNYNLVKRKILDEDSLIDCKRIALQCTVNNENFVRSNNKIKQKLIDSFFPEITNALSWIKSENLNNASNAEAMSKNSGVNNALKTELVGRTSIKGIRKANASPTSTRVASSKGEARYSPTQEIKTSNYETRRISSPIVKNESPSSHSPRKNGESIYFNLPAKSKSNKITIPARSIPHYKIVAGTHFAVDAFSYGEIPNVKHYFLSHFHSDHYAGLKKSFNKLLYCTKITADLCISRLSVSPKYINVINVGDTIRLEGVEVTAVDANHCPGAVMFIFTLPNGKTLLHTGDFRATPAMESYPIFWNIDIHTIYLDTTYCNPRYDFPTQDQSLEMALYILRQKKFILEKSGKKFSSVLIVCGTYTIGKEKFFLGMARRVGCSVWACPEKDRVLQTVEGRSFSHAPPQSCQLHVVPMRDLTLEKLRTYLDSLNGAFNEVVAFKPSGWENGKNSAIEKDMVTIHGIPYSEHSSFSELIRFVKYLKPKQVVPTVDISGGVKSVQKYFPCPMVYKDDTQCQSKVTDYFNSHKRQQVTAVS